MTDSNNNNNKNGSGERLSTSVSSSSSVLGLLDLLDVAALNRSMNHSQAAVNGGHDLVQTLLLRHLLSNDTVANRSHCPCPSTLSNFAPSTGFNQPAPSGLSVLDLPYSNSNADVAAQHSLTTRQDPQMGSPLPNFSLLASAAPNELLRYVLASQNNSLRDLSSRLTGISEAPSTSASFLTLPASSRFMTGNSGAANLHEQPFIGHVSCKGDASLQSPPPNTCSIPGSKSPQQQTNKFPNTNSEGDYITPVFTESERYVLSDYQTYLRQQLVYVETERAAERKGGKIQGRNKPITARQVGVMCIHCAKIPYDARPRGAVYYPATLEGIYQAAQNMSKNHFEVRCQSIPEKVRNQLIHLKRTKSVNVGTGKDYWKNSAENLGICEVDSRLFFENSMLQSKR